MTQSVYHSNEGHAGFLNLERIRELVTDGDLSFAEAVEAVRTSTIFTTHTPVPAGIDRYDLDLMGRYFESFVQECRTTFDELIALGLETESQEDPMFNMAVMGLRLAGRANGVSKLHGQVSRSMFKMLWPEVPEDEVPITSVTNGVHTSTWLGTEIAEIFNRRLSPGWAENERGALGQDQRGARRRAVAGKGPSSRATRLFRARAAAQTAAGSRSV